MRRLGSRFTVAVAVALAVAMVGGLAPAPASASAGNLGARTGFAPTSRMLLWGSDADLARDLDLMKATGAGWIRFDFDWASAEATRGSYNWAYIDRVVRQATMRGLRILATPAYTPAWARPAGTTDKTPPTDPAAFAAFVGAAVRRYSPMGVRHWEIWNEPNIIHFWKPRPDASAYATLLMQASAAVRAADPGATVISAGLAPAADTADGNYVSPRTFLSRLYAAGARSSFDAVGMHPYAFPYGIGAVGDWNQFQSMPKTAALLAAHGDGHKKIWATEFGAPTGTDSQAMSEAGQANMISTAWAQWSQWPYAGPIFWYAARDVGTDPLEVEDNFGLVRKDFTAKVALGEFTRVMGLPDPAGAGAGASFPAVPGPAAAETGPVPPGGAAPSDHPSATTTAGYWMVTATGEVHAFGDSPHLGDAAVGGVAAVDLEPTPDGGGYWVVDARGSVHAFGNAAYLGGNPGLAAGERVTSLSALPSGGGYWLFTTTGRVLTYGSAPHFGDMGGVRLNAPVLDSIPTPSGGGYYLVGADGGIFTFGDAAFAGSTGDLRLNAPVQSLVPAGDGHGYWLVASDGGIFSFGSPFYGSMGGTPLNRPVTGMVGGENGYLMVGEDGGIFTFGEAAFLGSLGDRPPASPVTSVAVLRSSR
ncbi:MAG TPA: cellulase family glycosylhydrolase [Acidimicrobiales bacterium]|nr:cellulase family glycosylhydrolase [Acidimicrobiales bacterium]